MLLAMESCLHLVFYGKLIKLGQTVAGVVRIDPSMSLQTEKPDFQRDGKTSVSAMFIFVILY